MVLGENNAHTKNSNSTKIWVKAKKKSDKTKKPFD